MQVIYYASTPAEAVLMVDYLEQRGIDAKATNLDQSSLFGSVPINEGDSQPTVWVVNDADLPRAQELIDEHNRRLESASDGSDADASESS